LGGDFWTGIINGSPLQGILDVVRVESNGQQARGGCRQSPTSHATWPSVPHRALAGSDSRRLMLPSDERAWGGSRGKAAALPLPVVRKSVRANRVFLPMHVAGVRRLGDCEQSRTHSPPRPMATRRRRAAAGRLGMRSGSRRATGVVERPGAAHGTKAGRD
jgi:hypothetical protein